MPTTVDDIKDPLTGLAYCKERMKKCEQRAQLAEQDESLPPAKRLELVAKFEGHLFAWSELAQKYLHSAFQQGQTSDDLLKTPDGVTIRAGTKGKRANNSKQPRTMGDGSDGKGVAVEEHPAVAAGIARVRLQAAHPEMLQTVGEVQYPLSQVPSQGSDDAEGSDTDSSGTETE